MAGSIEKNQEKRIILYLYLLHHPDHGYAIAKEFLDARKSGNWSKNKYSDLSNYKVYTALKQMLAEEMISTNNKTHQASEAKEKTNSYYPRTEFITKQETIKKKDPNTSILLQTFIEYLTLVSPDKQRCIREISSIKRYDNLTILCYLKKLLRETAELNSLAQPKIGEHEKHASSGEFDMMRKLSDEIVKTRKSPLFLKPVGPRDTYLFFKENLAKKGYNKNLENERSLLELFNDAEKRIDEYLIEYSYSDRIPTKN